MPDTDAPLAEGLPPDQIAPNGPQLAFLKLDPTQRQTVVILSHTWTGGITHYAGGRMKLHAAEECPYCKTGQRPRWYAWLHVLAPRTGREFVVQLATSQHAPLLKHMDTHHTLRGSTALLERPGKTPNTPTKITFLSAPDNGAPLPDQADLATILARQMEWTSGSGSARVQSTPPEGSHGKDRP